jgi:hypothetical protein
VAIQLSTAVRNARLDAIEVTIGTAAVLEIRSGPQPATCATADSGTLIASMALASDWMAAAGAGVKALAGSWTDASANNAATAAHFRIKDTGATVCGMQGSVTITGGGGDITLDAVVITAGQAVTITSFNLTDGNS